MGRALPAQHASFASAGSREATLIKWTAARRQRRRLLAQLDDLVLKATLETTSPGQVTFEASTSAQAALEASLSAQAPLEASSSAPPTLVDSGADKAETAASASDPPPPVSASQAILEASASSPRAASADPSMNAATAEPSAAAERLAGPDQLSAEQSMASDLEFRSDASQLSPSEGQLSVSDESGTSQPSVPPTPLAPGAWTPFATGSCTPAAGAGGKDGERYASGEWFSLLWEQSLTLCHCLTLHVGLLAAARRRSRS